MKRIEVKICGMTSLDDARMALDLGADYIGFVLYRRSPRFVAPRKLRRIADQLPATARVVAVFVNETRRTVEQIAADCALHAVQLHGDEKPGAFEGLPITLWRAVRYQGRTWVPRPWLWPAERFVVDAAVRGQYGGTGRRTDWKAAARFAARRPVMLAGGLTPENVARAIRAVRPGGVDAVSGVESVPGRKDPVRMERFIRAAKAAVLR